jgi:hypothetical protein
VGGLPWLNPANVRGVKPEGPKKNFFFFLLLRWWRPRGAPRGRLQGIFIFIFFSPAQAAPQGTSRSAASPLAERRRQKNKIKNFVFFFFFQPATSRSAAGPPAPRQKNKNKKTNFSFFVLF